MASDHSILRSYQELLAEQVAAGRLDAATQAVRLLHANRVLEACLRSLTPEALQALVHVWFPGTHSGGGYARVIQDLQELVQTRPRVPRRPFR